MLVPSGLGPVSALTLNKAATTLYVASGSSASLSVIDVASGTVTQTLHDGTGGVTGLAGASAISVVQDAFGNDEYVLVSSASGNAVSVLAVVAGKGLVFEQLLRNGTASATGLDGPGTILPGPTGTVLVATAGSSNDPGGLTALTLTALGTASPAQLLTQWKTLNSVSLTTGSGDDSVAVNAAVSASTLSVSTGAGDDNVSLQYIAATTTVDLGDGDDQADLRATNAGTLTLSGGPGSDTIDVLAAGPSTVLHVYGGSATDPLAADSGDTVYVAGKGLAAGAQIDLHGDLPNANPGGDTLIYDAQGGTLSSNTSSTRGTAGYATVTFDTFENVTNEAAPTISITSPAPFTEGTGVSASRPT